jgi:hypothetical protein
VQVWHGSQTPTSALVLHPEDLVFFLFNKNKTEPPSAPHCFQLACLSSVFFVASTLLELWYFGTLVVMYRGNGGIHRGIYQLQGDDNGHVGRP